MKEKEREREGEEREKKKEKEKEREKYFFKYVSLIPGKVLALSEYWNSIVQPDVRGNPIKLFCPLFTNFVKS